MYTVDEQDLDRAYMYIEGAVQLLAQPNPNIMIDRKMELTNEFFTKLMVEFDLEQVD